jgi:hypothetical protein
MSQPSTYARQHFAAVISLSLGLLVMAIFFWSYLAPPADRMPALNRHIIPYFQHMAAHQEHNKETPMVYFFSEKITQASSHKVFRPTPPHACLPVNHPSYNELLHAYQLTVDATYHVAAPSHPERLAYTAGLYELWLAATCFDLSRSEIVGYKHDFLAAATSLRPYGFVGHWHASW